MRQHQLRRRRIDPYVAQLAHQAFAQRRIAETAAIPEQGAQPRAHHLLVIAVHPHVRQPLHRRKAVAHRDRVGLGLELFAHEPHDVHRAAQLSGFLFSGRTRVLHVQHVEARAAARLHQAARHQHLERHHHRVLRVAVQLRQLAQGRQLVARAIDAVGDLLPDQPGQAFGDGRGALGPAGRICFVHDRISTGWLPEIGAVQWYCLPKLYL
ncbi:hypothetical protein D3C72_1695210 [compost metagenome]